VAHFYATKAIFFQGHTLFQTHDNREHLAMMEKILGKPMPQHLVQKTRTKYFGQNQELLWDPSSPEAKYTNKNCRTLQMYQRYDRNTSLGIDEMDMYDLIARMLEYDSSARIRLKDALRHQFFDTPICDDSALHNHILRLQI
jgi:hypothetical protein